MRPKFSDHARPNKEEDVVRLGLPHELADEIGAYLRIRIREPMPKLLQRQVAVPKEVGTAPLVGQALRWSKAEHTNSVTDRQRMEPDAASGRRSVEAPLS